MYTREKRGNKFDIQNLASNQIKIFINLELQEKKNYTFKKKI